ncbi:hypothetical protein OAT03_01250 [Candidatus Pelagibacter sp.]|jgi:hypothetical protein|nr:hypothetical protein [Candidatus Pelagibacter sp.]
MFSLNLKKIKITFIILLIFFGSFIRFYNLNFDDLWSDEMVSYWLSNPFYSFSETISLIFESNLMVSFEIILKVFHKLFGYDVHVSRYLNALISVFSIILFANLLRKNSVNINSILYGTFLLAFNIFHIRYAMELRSYTLTFFLALILINLLFEDQYLKKKISYLDYFLIIMSSLLMLFSHSFSVIIIFSLNFYILYLWFFKKNDNSNLIKIFFLNIFIIIFFLIFYLKSVSHTPNWIEQLDISFFTNYFFSNFFGSRLIGGVYLVVLLYLLTKSIKQIINKANINLFFLILIFFSYFLPGIYGFIFEPVLINRYIIFVLIPILFLISHLTYESNNNLVKKIFLSLIVILTFFNHFTENTFKQFYTNIYPSKPEIRKTLEVINKSNSLNYSVLLDVNNKLNINTIYENYLNNYSKKLEFNLNFINYLDKKTLPNDFWIIHIRDITVAEFKKPNNFLNYKIKEKKYFNRLELYKLEKNGT